MPEDLLASNADAKKAFKTVRQTLRQTAERLQGAGMDQPELAAEILTASVLNCPRLELYLRTNEKLTSAQLESVREGTRRLGKHEPIQYVLGRTDFMGCAFKCDRRALIPRPETEELVELVIGYKPLWQIDSPAVLDVGTGSGCIIISLALLKKKGNFWAVDVSPKAIELAKENALAHNVAGAIKFLTADFADEAVPSGLDAVVANPPYVRTADFLKLEKNVRLWEPRVALDGGEDGLQVMRPLVGRAFQILKPDRFLFLEIGFDQWPPVRRLLEKNGFSKSFLRRDQAGQNRLVMAVK